MVTCKTMSSRDRKSVRQFIIDELTWRDEWLNFEQIDYRIYSTCLHGQCAAVRANIQRAALFRPHRPVCWSKVIFTQSSQLLPAADLSAFIT
jgi:hypothetical protein